MNQSVRAYQYGQGTPVLLERRRFFPRATSHSVEQNRQVHGPPPTTTKGLGNDVSFFQEVAAPLFDSVAYPLIRPILLMILSLFLSPKRSLK
jgi:hypothetical protein